MKLKKDNTAVFVLILFMTFFLIINFISIMSMTGGIDELGIILIIMLLCPIIFVAITYTMRNKKHDKLYDKFKDGNKITGFVVSTFKYKYSRGRYWYGISYGLKVLASNKIYIVDRIENNEFYKIIENKLNNIQINYDIISFEKIPVDVYLKNDDYFVDIESIKI